MREVEVIDGEAGLDLMALITEATEETYKVVKKNRHFRVLNTVSNKMVDTRFLTEERAENLCAELNK